MRTPPTFVLLPALHNEDAELFAKKIVDLWRPARLSLSTSPSGYQMRNGSYVESIRIAS
jgi:hypothetical protein